MRILSSAHPHIRSTVAAAIVTIALAAPASAWQTAHGDPDNTGTVDVPTAPAAQPVATVPRLGGIAPGAAPVIAPDGTLYLGNLKGTLRSFGPDGRPGWSTDILGFQQIRTSPAATARCTWSAKRPSATTPPVRRRSAMS